MNAMTAVNSQLAAVRRRRGVSASGLAKDAGVSRQTIYAIEAGTYVPNTEVTLRLARALEVSVEELFALREQSDATPERITADILDSAPSRQGQPVRVCRIVGRLVAVPASASPYYLPEADGVISRVAGSRSKAQLSLFSKEESAEKRLVMAGCDPAMSLLCNMVRQTSGVEVVTAGASSKLALQWLKEGKVHIAGSHLEDRATGDFNVPYLKREFAWEDLAVVTFANWEEGLLTAAGNPKQLKTVDDLARRDLRFVNRQLGSGSRLLLDSLLTDRGIPSARVKGYERIADGHLAAAWLVASAQADCCLATRSAARSFGLDFIPLHAERYDLVMRKESLALPAVQAFLDVLQRSALRRKLEALAGYDTSRTGAVVV
jgi:molybdate-binding protein/DNA-binding XRE family transcriptional regulator